MMLSTEISKENLNRTISWIKQADQKTFALLGFQGIYIGFYVSKFDLIAKVFSANLDFVKGFILALLILFTILITISFIYTIKTIFQE